MHRSDSALFEALTTEMVRRSGDITPGKNKALTEGIEEAMKTSNTPKSKPIRWGGGLYQASSGTEVIDPFTRQRGHWLFKDQDGHYAIGLTSTQYQGPTSKIVYQVEVHWAGAEHPGPGVKPEFWFAARKDSGAFLNALSKRFGNYDAAADYWYGMYKKTFKKQEVIEVDPVEDVELIEKAPPGWAGTVKAMKKHMGDDKAFALAWSGYKKGHEPHYKDDGQSTKSKGKPEKKAKYAAEEIEMQEEKTPQLKPNQSVVFKQLDLGNNEGKSIAITKETDGTFTAMTYSQSKNLKTYPGAKKWLEKKMGKKLAGGVVEGVEVQEAAGDQEQDLTHIADPSKLQKDIEQKLGLANMKGPQDVLKLISTMYSAKEVPNAVYAAAAGMARAEQRLSAPMAKAMNQLDAATVAAAIAKGVEGTKAPTIKNMEQWWMGEIGKLAGDRSDGQQNAADAGDLPSEVQPYIDSMATESFDGVFEQAMGDAQCDQHTQPIGSGALSGPDAIGTTDGFSEPSPMGGNDNLSRETGVDHVAAAAAIEDGKPQSNKPARAVAQGTKLPGENRVRPGQYTAESFDELDFETRLRLAEAYDRLVGGAPDLGQEEVVDAEAYKAMLQGRHSNSMGTSTPVATPEGKTGGEVVVDDVDDAFDTAVEAEDERAA